MCFQLRCDFLGKKRINFLSHQPATHTHPALISLGGWMGPGQLNTHAYTNASDIETDTHSNIVQIRTNANHIYDEVHIIRNVYPFLPTHSIKTLSLCALYTMFDAVAAAKNKQKPNPSR